MQKRNFLARWQNPVVSIGKFAKTTDCKNNFSNQAVNAIANNRNYQVFSFLPLPNRHFSDKIIYVVIFWRRIEVVITGRTRNALALRGTWVQIPPSPRIKSR